MAGILDPAAFPETVLVFGLKHFCTLCTSMVCGKVGRDSNHADGDNRDDSDDDYQRCNWTFGNEVV